MDTVIFNIGKDQQLIIEGNYQPEEPIVMYYKDGSGYPGTSACFEIDKVVWIRNKMGFDITQIFDFLDEKDKYFEWSDFTDIVTKEYENNTESMKEDNNFKNKKDE